MYDLATYFAWLVLALLFGVMVALIVWLGSLPKQIAERRGHPQVDAINACSWLGLAFGGLGWAVAMIWALWRPQTVSPTVPSASDDRSSEITRLQSQIDALQAQLRLVQNQES